VTIHQASKDWIKRFILTARERKNPDMESFLISLEPESLYIQDNSENSFFLNILLPLTTYSIRPEFHAETKMLTPVA
jgi:hypothetical protein